MNHPRNCHATTHGQPCPEAADYTITVEEPDRVIDGWHTCTDHLPDAIAWAANYPTPYPPDSDADDVYRTVHPRQIVVVPEPHVGGDPDITFPEPDPPAA